MLFGLFNGEIWHFYTVSWSIVNMVQDATGETGFAQVMENLESHGICYFNFQAWKVME